MEKHREYYVKEFDIELSGNGEITQIQYFCNSENEPIYFPDRTLAALFHVNLSTLRGRFNRLTKKYHGFRLLISEKSKTRLSSFHSINWSKPIGNPNQNKQTQQQQQQSLLQLTNSNNNSNIYNQLTTTTTTTASSVYNNFQNNNNNNNNSLSIDYQTSIKQTNNNNNIQQAPSSPTISSPNLNGNSSPLHGLVALNHVKLVNVALAEWIANNHERLGTNITYIEENFIKSDIPYVRQGDKIIVQVTQKEDLNPPFPGTNNFFQPYFPRQFSPNSSTPAICGSNTNSNSTNNNNNSNNTNNQNPISGLTLSTPLSSGATTPTSLSVQPSPFTTSSFATTHGAGPNQFNNYNQFNSSSGFYSSSSSSAYSSLSSSSDDQTFSSIQSFNRSNNANNNSGTTISQLPQPIFQIVQPSSLSSTTSTCHPPSSYNQYINYQTTTSTPSSSSSLSSALQSNKPQQYFPLGNNNNGNGSFNNSTVNNINYKKNTPTYSTSSQHDNYTSPDIYGSETDYRSQTSSSYDSPTVPSSPMGSIYDENDFDNRITETTNNSNPSPTKRISNEELNYISYLNKPISSQQSSYLNFNNNFNNNNNSNYNYNLSRTSTFSSNSGTIGNINNVNISNNNNNNNGNTISNNIASPTSATNNNNNNNKKRQLNEYPLDERYNNSINSLNVNNQQQYTKPDQLYMYKPTATTNRSNDNNFHT